MTHWFRSPNCKNFKQTLRESPLLREENLTELIGCIPDAIALICSTNRDLNLKRPESYTDRLQEFMFKSSSNNKTFF